MVASVHLRQGCESRIHIPGGKKIPPVYKLPHVFHRYIFIQGRPGCFRFFGSIIRPVYPGSTCRCFGQGQKPGRFSHRLPKPFLFFTQLQDISLPCFRIYQLCGNNRILRGIFYMNDRMAVTRRNLHRRMQFRRSSSAYHQRDAQSRLFHFSGYVAHLFKGRSYKAAQSHKIHILFLCFLYYILGRNHNSHVHHIEIITGKNHRNDIFPYVMDISLHGSQQKFSGLSRGGIRFFLFYIWL